VDLGSGKLIVFSASASRSHDVAASSVAATASLPTIAADPHNNHADAITACELNAY